MQTNLNANPKSRARRAKANAADEKFSAQTAGSCRVCGVCIGRRGVERERQWRARRRDAVSQQVKTGTGSTLRGNAIKRPSSLSAATATFGIDNGTAATWRLEEERRRGRERTRERERREGRGHGQSSSLYYAEFRRFAAGGLVCRPTNRRLKRLFKRRLRFWPERRGHGVTGAARKSFARRSKRKRTRSSAIREGTRGPRREFDRDTKADLENEAFG